MKTERRITHICAAEHGHDLGDYLSLLQPESLEGEESVVAHQRVGVGQLPHQPLHHCLQGLLIVPKLSADISSI